MPKVELGAHGVSRRLEREIRESKRQLENSREQRCIRSPTRTGATPNGAGSGHPRRLRLRGGHVKNAVAHLDDDPFAIARWIVTEQTTPARIILGSRAN